MPSMKNFGCLALITKEITTNSNTSLVCQSNFVAAIASYLHLFNMHLIKTNITTLALQFFLTSKQKLHKVACQSQPLGSLNFQKGWIRGQESVFKRDKKGALGTDGNTTAYSKLSA